MRRASGVGTRAAKGADGLGVEDVAAQGGGHLEVMADEVEDETGFVGVELQAFDDVLRHARGLCGVAGAGVAFAGVVQQGGEHRAARDGGDRGRVAEACGGGVKPGG